MSSIEFVSINGTPIDIGSIPTGRKRKSSTAQVEDRGHHKGWVVEGHRPGAKEEAQKAAETAWRDWHSMTEKQRADAMKDGRRAPKPWDGDKWEAKTRKVRASRAFGIPSAADQMAEMLRRAGWICVVVTELKREPAKKVEA